MVERSFNKQSGDLVVERSFSKHGDDLEVEHSFSKHGGDLEVEPLCSKHVGDIEVEDSYSKHGGDLVVERSFSVLYSIEKVNSSIVTKRFRTSPNCPFATFDKFASNSNHRTFLISLNTKNV